MHIDWQCVSLIYKGNIMDFQAARKQLLMALAECAKYDEVEGTGYQELLDAELDAYNATYEDQIEL